MVKKFYVGARHIGVAVSQGENSSCQCETLEEAIAQAKDSIRNSQANCLVIVEIVRIVRKDFPPITVETV